jgi:hypothetical protein
MAAQPKVDDQFWFDQSRDAIEQASKRLTEAASRIGTTLIWLWSAYTAAVSVGSAFGAKYDIPLAAEVILVIPIPLLLLGYVFANWAQVNPLVEFDPRVPQEIIDAFSESMRIRWKRLNIAVWLAIFAAVLVATAIATASIAKPNTAFGLTALVTPKANGVDTLFVSGHFPPKTLITFRFVSNAADGWNHVGEWTRVTNKSVLSSATGELHLDSDVEHNPYGYEIISEWIDSGKTVGLTSEAK